MSALSEITCRACLNTTPVRPKVKFVHMFNTIPEHQIASTEYKNVSELFTAYTNLEIHTFEPKLNFFCKKCYNMFVDFHNFNIMCIKSNDFLLQKYGNKTEETDPLEIYATAPNGEIKTEVDAPGHSQMEFYNITDPEYVDTNVSECQSNHESLATIKCEEYDENVEIFEFEIEQINDDDLVTVKCERLTDDEDDVMNDNEKDSEEYEDIEEIVKYDNIEDIKHEDDSHNNECETESSDGPLYPCKCGQTFTDFTLFLDHIKQNHTKKIKRTNNICKVCGRAFTSWVIIGLPCYSIV